MPRIKRWFPVSHDINHDEKMRDLMREFGLTGFRIWLEILSIADRCGEFIDCTSEGALSRLTSASETKKKITSKVVLWLQYRGCIALEDPQNHVTRVVNYWDFHRNEVRKKFPPDQTIPDLTRPKDPEPAAQRPDLPKKELDPKIKKVTARIYSSDTQKFTRLIQWVRTKQSEHYPNDCITKTLTAFEPHSAVIKDWWAYLEKIIRKEYPRIMEAEHERRKDEERNNSLRAKGALLQRVLRANQETP